MYLRCFDLRSRTVFEAPVKYIFIETRRPSWLIFLTARLAAPDVADRDLAESVLSSTYWGREDDLDIEYSIISQQNANLMLAYCLRHWFNIKPTLAHVTSRVW